MPYSVSARTTALLAIVSALTRIAGAILLGISGADLDRALVEGTVAGYLL